MADLLDRQHIDAGMNLLRADTELTVYPDAEGNVPAIADRPDHYLMVYATISRPRTADGNALDGRSRIWTTTWYTHAVGPNANSSAAVAMRANRALLDQRPTIAGRSVNPISQATETPPGRDKSTGRTVYDTVVTYEMVTSG